MGNQPLGFSWLGSRACEELSTGSGAPWPMEGQGQGWTHPKPAPWAAKSETDKRPHSDRTLFVHAKRAAGNHPAALFAYPLGEMPGVGFLLADHFTVSS